MYEIFRTNSFKKDYKKLSMQDKEIVKKVVTILANGEELTKEYKESPKLAQNRQSTSCNYN